MKKIVVLLSIILCLFLIPIAFADVALISPLDNSLASNQPKFVWSDSNTTYVQGIYLNIKNQPNDTAPSIMFKLVYRFPGNANYYYDFKEQSETLAPGTYYWRLLHPNCNCWTSWRSITVPQPAQISYSPQSFTFTAMQNSTNPPAQMLNISNGSATNLNWSILSSVTWLNVSPTFGINSSLVTIWPNITGLPVGTYYGQIFIEGNALPDYPATNSPVNIPVTLSITQPTTSQTPTQPPTSQTPAPTPPKKKVKVATSFHKKKCKDKEFHAKHCKVSAKLKKKMNYKKLVKVAKQRHKKKCTKVILK